MHKSHIHYHMYELQLMLISSLNLSFPREFSIHKEVSLTTILCNAYQYNLSLSITL